MTTLLTLDEIRVEVERLAGIIGAPGTELPTYGYSEQSGRPHIEVDERGYCYVVAERGTEFSRDRTTDLDELLYVVFKSVTRQSAREFAMKHRVIGQDSRRPLFKHQLEVMSILSPMWAERLAEFYKGVLREYPFDDRTADDLSK